MDVASEAAADTRGLLASEIMLAICPTEFPQGELREKGRGSHHEISGED